MVTLALLKISLSLIKAPFMVPLAAYAFIKARVCTS